MLLSLFSLALADVVGPPATNCPPGSYGTSSHGGPYCVPNEPDPDTCPDGAIAREVGLCVLEEVRPCTGNAEPDCTYVHREALKACNDELDCVEENVPCEIAERCVEPGLCGCDQSGPAAGFVLLGLLPLLTRRRSRR